MNSPSKKNEWFSFFDKPVLFTIADRIKSILSRNAVWVPPEPVEDQDKIVFNVLMDYIKGEVWSVFSKDEVKEWYFWSRKHWVYKIFNLVDSEWNSLVEENAKKDIQNKEYSPYREFHVASEKAEKNDFCYLSEANVHIKMTKNTIKKWVIETWKNCINYDVLEAYVNKWYITKKELTDWINSYIFKTALEAIEKAQSPLFAKSRGWEKQFIREYHDLDHDLLPEYQVCLAFAIVKGWIDGKEMKAVTDILKAEWDSLEYFIWNYFDAHLSEDKLKRLHRSK